MAKHTVLKNVHHDGERYGKGSIIDLTPAQAKPLIEVGHVMVTPSKADKDPK